MSQKEMKFTDSEKQRLALSSALHKTAGLTYIHFKKLNESVYVVSRTKLYTWEYIDPDKACSIQQFAISQLSNKENGMWFFSPERGWRMPV